MTKKGNVLRILTYLATSFMLFYLISMIVHEGPSFGLCYGILVTLMMGILFPAFWNYDHKTYKPEEVEFNHFKTHVAVTIDGRIFTYNEKNVMYHLLSADPQAVNRIMCKQGYNLYWCNADFDVILDNPVKAEVKPKIDTKSAK